MRPVVTVGQMREADAAAAVPEEVLVGRAGWAVARSARRMLGKTYGARVVVIAGPGNNGADGRVAASHLAARGAQVTVVEANRLVPRGPWDLVIDAAFGTGFHGEYRAPERDGVPTLAVDIPSGVEGDTGVAQDGSEIADVTVTFAALKPGHLLHGGPDRCGAIEVVDIGLDLHGVGTWLVEDDDVRDAVGPVAHESHKWRSSVVIIAGSPGMHGAAVLAARGAARAGAGMVRLAIPGAQADGLPIGEAVARALDGDDWHGALAPDLERSRALVIGPGLGRRPETIGAVLRLLERTELPAVVDGDALFALGESGVQVLRRRQAPTVLTPHDGEFARLAGAPPGARRYDDVRALARRSGAIVLAKGSTSIIAAPHGAEVLFSATGDGRLATAGTGDVLAGAIGAFLAKGLEPLEAAAFAAHVHGAAASTGYEHGFIAGDLPECIARWLSGATMSGDD